MQASKEAESLNLRIVLDRYEDERMLLVNEAKELLKPYLQAKFL